VSLGSGAGEGAGARRILRLHSGGVGGGMTLQDNAGGLPQIEVQVVGTVHHKARVMASTAPPLNKLDGRGTDDQFFTEMEVEALHGRSVRNSEKSCNIK